MYNNVNNQEQYYTSIDKASKLQNLYTVQTINTAFSVEH